LGSLQGSDHLAGSRAKTGKEMAKNEGGEGKGRDDGEEERGEVMDG